MHILFFQFGHCNCCAPIQTGMENSEKDMLMTECGQSVMSNKRILKNITMACVVFMMTYTHFALIQLQSSLYEEGLGVTSTSVMYVAMSVSSMVLPKLMETCIGHKWSLTVSITGYLVWTLCNGHATWATLVPASFIMGVTSSTLWTSMLSYITILSREYAKRTSQTEEVIVSRTLGLYYSCTQLGESMMPF